MFGIVVSAGNETSTQGAEELKYRLEILCLGGENTAVIVKGPDQSSTTILVA